MTAAAPAREAGAQRRRPDAPTRTVYQAFIHSLPCVACGKPPPSEFATVVGAAGLSISPDDRYLVSVCGPATVWGHCCHSRLHYRGPRRFWSELGIDPLDLARHLWRVSGDPEAGAYLVALARQRIVHTAGRGEGARS